MEIYWRDNFSCPSEDDYRQMVVRSKYIQDTCYAIYLYYIYSLFCRNWWFIYVGNKAHAIVQR